MPLWYRSPVRTLSLTGKRWTVGTDLRGMLPAGARDRDEALLNHLLEQRGIDALPVGLIPEEFGPDASLFPDLDRALTRIRAAVKKKETIGVFGDYDCDGITGAALLTRMLRRRGIEPVVRLPHRLHDGYGLKSDAVRDFAKAGVTLLLTVDTGITALREIAEAGTLGIDVIVLDHHTVPAELPVAHALLHPALAPGFPEPHPAAAGIAWSVVRALEILERGDDWDDRETDLALAAIGTIADLVPLQGANRSLVHRGLISLSRLDRGPIGFLRMQAEIPAGPVSSQDVAFRLAPRLNAAGRMAEPTIALNALLGDQAAAAHLEELNRSRQDTVAALMDEALARAAALPSAFVCLRDERYQPGICGLIAGKLCEKTGRPVLVAHERGDQCTASLRGIPAYNVTTGLRRAADLLTSFGGHAMAAGCTFPVAAFEELRERLAADVEASVDADDLFPRLAIDACVDIAHLTLPLCERLLELEPVGQGNPAPRFLLRNIRLDEPRVVGRDASHLQARVGRSKAIGFRLGHLMAHLDAPVDIACHLGIDTWRDARQVQVVIDDIRAAVTEETPVSTASAKKASA